MTIENKRKNVQQNKTNFNFKNNSQKEDRKLRKTILYYVHYTNKHK